MNYLTNTDADRQEMLAAIGVSSIENLFDDIPQPILDSFKPIGLAPKSELDVVRHIQQLESENSQWQDYSTFLGGGIYDHFIPSVVSNLVSRSEFYTAYTPYQPELSQGTLATMFEFQTMVCELTGMEIASASMYDGATALAEGALMADRIVGTGRVAICDTLFPHYRRVVDTYCQAAGVETLAAPFDEKSGQINLDGLPDGDYSALLVQTPNMLGVVERLDGIRDALQDALLVVAVNPLSLGILSPPGEAGADIVVGEGQPFGISSSFGGPLLGLFAARKRFLRQMPGRISGRTVDVEGNVGYTLTAQTREQHIRRQKATSNICTNSALCALAATIYLSSLGSSGLQEIARLNLSKASYLADRLIQLSGFELAYEGPFFNEFVLRVPCDPQLLQEGLQREGILVGAPQDLSVLAGEDKLRLAVTEKRTREELDRLVELLRELS